MYKSNKNIYQAHSCFYYYSCTHLALSMYPFIVEGLLNNELIYISAERNLFNYLYNIINIENSNHNKHFFFHSVKELIFSYKTGGIKLLHNTIKYKVVEAKEKGCNGIRWICQPTFAIQETSKKDFLIYETGLTKALVGTDCSLICIYDVKDCLTDKQYIDEEVMTLSFNTHSYLLYKNNLVEF